jgi:hypothetical protein
MAEEHSAANWFWKKMDSLTETRTMSPEEIRKYQLEKEQQLNQSSSNPLDKLYHKILATAGICTPNIEQVKDYLEKATHYTNRAKQITSFVSVDSTIADKLDQSTEAINAIHEHLEKYEKTVGDISAACDISNCIDILNKWASDPNADNKVAAEAFDKLFGATSRFAAKLPAPANAYSKILAQISISHFFKSMYDLGQTRTGENTSNAYGRQMKDVLDSIDNQFSPPK